MTWAIIKHCPTYYGTNVYDFLELLWGMLNSEYVKTQKIIDNILDIAWAAIKLDV
jgi:hypothetical protein